jgi:IclR family transcriptional regulator, acetate operon repressor
MANAIDDATAQHVSRTLRTLELLAGAGQTQADIARQLAIHRRTARRLLARLVAEGYAEPSRRGRQTAFVATPRLAVLGRQVADGLDLIAIGRRHLHQLSRPDIDARFIALLGAEGTWLAHADTGDGEASAVGSPSVCAPLHATAAGKVFLSADTELLGETLNHELLAFTSRTLVARADLLLALASIRTRGYATEDGEYHSGMRAVAAGVTNHVGKVIAALGATLRADAELSSCGGLVREVARSFSREIGGADDTNGSDER